MLADEPQLKLDDSGAWIWHASVDLTFPAHGRVGRVGVIKVDTHGGKVRYTDPLLTKIQSEADRLAQELPSRYPGIERSDTEVRRTLGARKYWSPSSAIEKLDDANIDVIYQSWSAADLLSMLDAGYPAVVFVRTIFRESVQEDYAHAPVVVGDLNQPFWVQEPAQQTAPNSVFWDGMLAAWSEFNYHGAIVRLR